MYMPSVNILIVSYNQESVVEQTVLSAVNQDYPNFSVVVSDDCSTDNTQNILKKLQKKYPEKLKVIFNEENLGITKNCNKALFACDAELIAVSGGDDVLYPSKLRKQALEFTKDKRLVFCYHPCHILSGGKIINTVGNRRKDAVKSFYEMISNYGADISGASPMLLHSAIPKNGYNESIPTASDWLLFIEVAKKGKVKRINEVLSQYRQYEGNIGKKIFNYADDFLKTLDFVSCKYSDDRKVEGSVRKGRKRFLLGIIFNAAVRDNSVAFNKYIKLYESFDYSGVGVLKLLDQSFIKMFLPSVRSLLKRFV